MYAGDGMHYYILKTFRSEKENVYFGGNSQDSNELQARRNQH